MKYAEIIERALIEVTGANQSLKALLSGVDALEKAVPSLSELNEALAELRDRKHVVVFGGAAISQEAYDTAVAENWRELMLQLKTAGDSSELQQALLERRHVLWNNHET